MKKSLFTLLLSTIVIFASAGIANAELIDRGGGLIYDTDLDITWLQDANYAYTSGYWDSLSHPSHAYPGQMTWDDAADWADQLVYGGHEDWRLASMDVDGDGTIVDCNGASKTACRDNEYGYMYYQNLGGSYGVPIFNTHPTGEQTVDAVELHNIGYIYWSDTEYSPYPGQDEAYSFHFSFRPGDQDNETKDNHYYAWAVRDGDVVLVPPISAFTASPHSGVEPLEVNFTDESTGTIDTWLWDFGDGYTGTERNPTHTYEYQDTYTVSLTVTGPEGSDTMTKTEYISVVSSDAPNLSGRCKEFHSYRFGEKIVVKVQVKNTGNEKADRFKVAFYLSDNGMPPGELIKEVTIRNGLKPGRAKVISCKHVSQDSLSGKYIIAVVDSDYDVPETDETNNRVNIRIP